MLRSHFSFADNDFKALDGFFLKLITTDVIERVLLKLQELKKYIHEANRTKEPIYNIPRYITKALLNQFGLKTTSQPDLPGDEFSLFISLIFIFCPLA